MSSAPIVDRIRIVPRPVDFLDRNVGSSGEIFFSRETNSLRVYSGKDRSGFEIARADFENVSDNTLSARIAALGITDSGASVDVGMTPPSEPSEGNLWLDTHSGRLYIYVNDGDSSQWIQPAVSSFSGNYNDLFNKPFIPSVPTSILDLNITDGSNGQVLTTDGQGGFSFTTVSSGGGGSQIPYEADPSLTYADGEYDFGSNIIKFANAIEQESELANYSPSTYHGMIMHVHNTGGLYYAHAGAWRKLLTDTSHNDAVGAGYTDPLSTVAYSGDYDDLTNIPSSFTDLTLSGLTTISQTTETLSVIDGADNVTEHDLSTGSIFYHTNIAANFTANFTNVPTTNNRTVSVVLILEQTVVGKIPNSIQINGVSQTLNWQGGVVPEGTADQIDIVSFTLIRANNAWTAIGSLTTYG